MNFGTALEALKIAHEDGLAVALEVGGIALLATAPLTRGCTAPIGSFLVTTAGIRMDMCYVEKKGVHIYEAVFLDQRGNGTEGQEEKE